MLQNTSVIGSDCALKEMMKRPMPYKCMLDTIDQTLLVTFLKRNPHAISFLPCGWNMQTNLYWEMYGLKNCTDKSRILHANYPHSLKKVLQSFVVQKHHFSY